jgi:NleD-like pathogen effector protein (putative zinc metallopeptidase)
LLSAAAVPRVVVGLAVLVMLGSSPARAELRACDPSAAEARELADALDRVARAVDPCGESPLVADVLAAIARCRARSYRICTRPTSRRNEMERPEDARGAPLPRTIVWNPALRTELERGCDGDPAAPVLRDPTASLLHELVHAADDCRGVNPGEHELDAVRIENAYRRAAGLCQRTGYGDVPLPASVVRSCGPRRCACEPGAPAAASARPADAGSERSTGDAP